jgi:hypothetical protein
MISLAVFGVALIFMITFLQVFIAVYIFKTEKKVAFCTVI